MENLPAFDSTAAVGSMVNIFVVIVCIALSWWGLQQFRFDLFLRSPKGKASVLLQIFIAIALGSEVARFFIDYFDWSTLLKGMF